MKPQNKRRRLAKLLSYVLGRRPYEFGLVLDENGFVSMQMLIKAIGEEKDWKFIRESHIHEILLLEPAAPIEIAGSRIRSVERSHLPVITISLDPPKLLYVCVRQKAHAHVLENGISSTVHAQVVLSADRDMALRMGMRNDVKAILLSVITSKCREQGVVFQRAGGCLFTAVHIPSQCISGPALVLEREPKDRAPEPFPQRPETPGSFILDPRKESPASSKFKGRKKEILWKKDRKRRHKNPEYS